MSQNHQPFFGGRGGINNEDNFDTVSQTDKDILKIISDPTLIDLENRPKPYKLLPKENYVPLDVQEFKKDVEIPGLTAPKINPSTSSNPFPNPTFSFQTPPPNGGGGNKPSLPSVQPFPLPPLQTGGIGFGKPSALGGIQPKKGPIPDTLKSFLNPPNTKFGGGESDVKSVNPGMSGVNGALPSILTKPTFSVKADIPLPPSLFPQSSSKTTGPFASSPSSKDAKTSQQPQQQQQQPKQQHQQQTPFYDGGNYDSNGTLKEDFIDNAAQGGEENGDAGQFDYPLEEGEFEDDGEFYDDDDGGMFNGGQQPPWFQQQQNSQFYEQGEEQPTQQEGEGEYQNQEGEGEYQNQEGGEEHPFQEGDVIGGGEGEDMQIPDENEGYHQQNFQQQQQQQNFQQQNVDTLGFQEVVGSNSGGGGNGGFSAAHFLPSPVQPQNVAIPIPNNRSVPVATQPVIKAPVAMFDHTTGEVNVEDDQIEKLSIILELKRLKNDFQFEVTTYNLNDPLDMMQYELESWYRYIGTCEGVDKYYTYTALGLNGIAMVNQKFGRKVKLNDNWAKETMGELKKKKHDYIQLYKRWNKRSSSNPLKNILSTIIISIVMQHGMNWLAEVGGNKLKLASYKRKKADEEELETEIKPLTKPNFRNVKTADDDENRVRPQAPPSIPRPTPPPSISSPTVSKPQQQQQSPISHPSTSLPTIPSSSSLVECDGEKCYLNSKSNINNVQNDRLSSAASSIDVPSSPTKPISSQRQDVGNAESSLGQFSGPSRRRKQEFKQPATFQIQEGSMVI